jgi:hypothetical protein
MSVARHDEDPERSLLPVNEHRKLRSNDADDMFLRSYL